MEPLSLHFVHEKAQARFSEVGGRELVASYGAPGGPEAEYRAAREAVAVHDASYREWVRLTGEDRASFLHGMVTQDVKGLAPLATAYATLVTVKGSMVADARLVRREEDLLLDVEPGAGARVREFLEKYLISEDAELHDATAQLGLLRLLGPQAPGLLGGLTEGPLPSPGTSRPATVAGVQLLLVGPPATGGFGVPQVDLLCPREGLEPVWAALTAVGARPLGYEALELLRVEAGTPRFGQDLVETTIPLEANLQHAISYNKGCYIGQEVIARATFRGHMNRTLAGFLLGDAPAPAGSDLMREGKRVGWLTSVVHSPRLGQWVALGFVRREVEPGTALQLGEGPRTATVRALPFG
ncbi:aminomethyl transferase family protein [Aggregicoccus sp. 17bor-14]|uniref:CAF17-like 4Fe-4S cluster assembly/insertion protein YgfZ n=1 Tax=Myxococcaceae TaxID=31 RepID=UPI00129C4338|nr:MULTISPECIES: glycine cleavage T C-terminal barrel domain-containing protein [Myxococcaceae]MBF5042462.1 aminomethyl transferase family protein [Simulacricoccus sp. 17bor-14]MRI88233.1 aminomethyl transferase family protein [Aggregicoccus sp. 17bor-14]